MTSAELSQLLTMTTVCADTVTLKLTIPDSHERPTTRALDIDPLEAKVRQLVYFDTPSLDLERHGVAMQALRVRGAMSDPVVHLAAVTPSSLPTNLRVGEDLMVEVAVMGGGFLCSAALTADRSGHRAIRDLFSKPQLALVHQQTPGGVDLDALTVLGPIFVLELTYSAEGFARPLTAEMWLYPDGSRTLQLATRGLPSEAFEVAAQTASFLSRHGVELDATRSTNLRTALEFFADDLSVVR